MEIPPKSTKATELKKYAYVDALRGWAILAVILVHVPQYLITEPLPSTIQRLADHGRFGVQLFYVISAFTLAMSLQGRKGEPMRNFFIRRFFRIAPMFYCALIYYLWQDGFGPRYWLGGAPRITVANVAATVFFVNSFHPQWITSIVPGGWSVAVEMCFYVLLPFLIIFARSRTGACKLLFITTILAIITVHILSRYDPIKDPRLWGDYLYLFLPNQLPVFCFGLVLFQCVQFRQQNETLAAIPLLGIAALVILDSSTTMRIPAHIAFASAFSCIAFFLSSYPLRILVNRWTAYIGKISFSLYLVHNAVLHFAARSFAHPILPVATADLALKFCGCVCISSLVASVTYRLVEMPTQALGKQIIRHLDQANLQPVTTAADA